MANPLNNEKELFEKIEKEKLTIPAPIWELLTHHIGNDLYAISMIAGSYVSGEDKEPIPPESGQKIINHTVELKRFLDKLSRSIGHK